MSGYLIKAVGIDLSTVNSGLCCLTMKAGSWEVAPVDASVVQLFRSKSQFANSTQAARHLSGAHRILEFVEKHRPDLVGIEDYTNQFGSHVSFSMGEMGGMVRLLLWQKGFRQLMISPVRIGKMVIHKKLMGTPEMKAIRKSDSQWKKFCVEWVRSTLKFEFEGDAKQQSDMADASIYGLIAAAFFSIYWLRQEPPMAARQKEIYYNKIPHPSSKAAKAGHEPNGLMDTPHRYLLRNKEKEHEVHSPEWNRVQPVDMDYIGA